MSAGEERDAAMRRLEHELGVVLRRARRGIGARAAAIHPELSPTSYLLLMTLIDFGPKRAADLSEQFAIDKGAVSRLVRHLEDLGFVERTPDPTDGRASVLAATPAAVQRFDELKAVRRREFGTRLAGWEPVEITTLAEGLTRFNETLAD